MLDITYALKQIMKLENSINGKFFMDSEFISIGNYKFYYAHLCLEEAFIEAYVTLVSLIEKQKILDKLK